MGGSFFFIELALVAFERYLICHSGHSAKERQLKENCFTADFDLTFSSLRQPFQAYSGTL